MELIRRSRYDDASYSEPSTRANPISAYTSLLLNLLLLPGRH